MKRIIKLLEPVCVITLWVVLFISILFTLGAVFYYPIAMSVAYSSGWWMLGYICYIVLIYFIYQIIK